MRRRNPLPWVTYTERLALLIGVGLGALLTSCAIINGSAYRVQPCPPTADTTAKADSIRRHIGCFDPTTLKEPHDTL